MIVPPKNIIVPLSLLSPSRCNWGLAMVQASNTMNCGNMTELRRLDSRGDRIENQPSGKNKLSRNLLRDAGIMPIATFHRKLASLNCGKHHAHGYSDVHRSTSRSICFYKKIGCLFAFTSITLRQPRYFQQSEFENEEVDISPLPGKKPRDYSVADKNDGAQSFGPEAGFIVKGFLDENIGRNAAKLIVSAYRGHA